MTQEHTATPWKVSRGHAVGAVTVRQDGGEFQRPVAEIWHNGDDPKANAEFIVTAVNSYASSQAEIARLRKALSKVASVLDVESYPENGSLESNLGKLARAALSEAQS